jgi:hypothetical protein
LAVGIEQAACPQGVHHQPRAAPRLPVSGVAFPFLGTLLPERGSFQFLLRDVSESGCQIALPSWVVKRELLRGGDRIDLHLPFVLNGVTYSSGRVAWARSDADSKGQVCGIHFAERAPLYYPVFVSLDSKGVALDLNELDPKHFLARRVLKDTMLLKRGIIIYLGHLRPVISRLTDYDALQLAELKTLLFDDTEQRLTEHIARLQQYLEETKKEYCHIARLPQLFDLEELRVLMEPEIEMSVWNQSFREATMQAYVSAIVSLENKLFYNYNTLVMMYAYALTGRWQGARQEN